MDEGRLKDILRKNRAEVKRVMWSDYNEELHLKDIRQTGFEEGYADGRNEGETRKLVEQVIKKVKKNQTLDQIAYALEEETDTLRPVYEAVVSAAPDFDVNMICRQLKGEQSEQD